MKKRSAERIIRTVNNWRQYLWPLWMRERALVAYYNGGEIPTDECADDAPLSIGLGHRYIKKPYEQLLDTILMNPGFIKTENCYPLRADRKLFLESSLDKEINAVVHKRMESTIRRIAGRSLITGRAFLFRLSKWDWLFKTGRLLHARSDCDDPYDESFREWAFMGTLTLREIDEKLSKLRDYKGAGWNYSALANLKKYILQTTAEEKDRTQTQLDRKMLEPFAEDEADNPLEVYWYCVKNGERNEINGDEKIDLYCVSCYNQTPVITSENGDYVERRYLEFTQGENADKNNQILYYLPNAFDSIKECLIPMILDSRVDGEQELAQIDGTGKIMLPRLQGMEQVGVSMIEGTSWAVQPNWTSNGQGVNEDMLREIAKTGLAPWDYVPAGIQPMQKTNSLTGLSAAMQIMQMLGMSAEQDGGTGEMSPFGQSQAKFKSEADQLVQQINSTVGRRSEKFWDVLDLMADSQVRTLTRSLQEWRKGDAGYYDARLIQTNLLIKYQIVPPEYSSERVSAKCRRLSGGGEKQQTVTSAVTTLNMFGSIMSPEGPRLLGREATRAMWGDPFAELLFPDKPTDQSGQQDVAESQNAHAMLALVPPQRRPTDLVQVHIPIHAQALGAHLQAAQQQGSISPAQQKGFAALLMHMAQDVQGLPPALQQQIAPTLQQMAMLLKKIPVSGAGSKQALDEHKSQREDAKLQFQMQREGNLQGDRQKKLELQNKGFMLDLQRYLLEEKRTGSDLAGALLDQMEQLRQAAIPPPQPDAGQGIEAAASQLA